MRSFRSKGCHTNCRKVRAAGEFLPVRDIVLTDWTIRLLIPVFGAGERAELFRWDRYFDTGLGRWLGGDASKLPNLRKDLTEVASKVDEATNAISIQDPSRAGAPLLAGLKQLRNVILQVESANLSPTVTNELLTNLRTKETQFSKAANLALGVTLDVLVDAADSGGAGGRGRRNQQTIVIAVPGQTFNVTARLYNRSKQTLNVQDIKLDTPKGWQVTVGHSDLKKAGPNENASVQFQVTVPPMRRTRGLTGIEMIRKSIRSIQSTILNIRICLSRNILFTRGPSIN